MSFQELVSKRQGENELFIELHVSAVVMAMIDSKLKCCSRIGKIRGSGWNRLCQSQPKAFNGVTITYVCLDEDIRDYRIKDSD